MIKNIPGLNENESKVYLALLNEKEAGATQLSKKTGLYRTFVYDILTKLNEKGMVSSIKKSGKKRYSPNPPDRLLERLREKENKTKKAVKELNKLFKKSKEETEVERHEGKEGMKAIIEDMFKTAKSGDMDEFYFLGPRGVSMEFLEGHLLDFISRANKLNLTDKIDLKGIWSSKIVTRKIINNLGNKEHHRFLPKGFESTSPVFIYGNKVAINGGKLKQFSVLIKNKGVADSFKNYFRLIWEQSKEEPVEEDIKF